jgi:putative colanic acid biosynthesis acetyltransferase WcaF
MPRHHPNKSYYSTKEIVLRILWGFIEPVFFRLSPRLLYGWRNFILRSMGATIGKGVQVFPSTRIMMPWLLKVGDHSVISWGVKVYNLGMVTIGHDTVISQYSHLCGGTHDYKSPDFLLLRTGLTIGNHVWIATDAFVGPGVIVEDNSVVAARAVVIRDVERNTVVAGNPAQPVQKRSPS